MESIENSNSFTQASASPNMAAHAPNYSEDWNRVFATNCNYNNPNNNFNNNIYNNTYNNTYNNNYNYNFNGAITYQKIKEPDTEATIRMKDNFVFFALSAFVYAVFYTFCMFQNDAGIAFLFFIIATLVFLCIVLKKLDMKLKKGSIFYFAAMLLLAISTFCTDDSRIIIFNKIGIFLLMMSLLLRQFYDTSEWKLGKHLSSIFYTAFGSFSQILRPFKDAKKYVSTKGIKTGNLKYMLLGTAIAVPFLIMVVALLSSADVFFSQMTSNLIDSFSDVESFADMFIRTVVVFMGVYLLIAYLCKHTLNENVTDMRNGEPLLAITITVLLTAVYILFAGIQIFGLFLGKLELPEGYTYAQYAREGFFQLLAVSILNLILVLVCLSFFRESKVLKVILAIMSLCTYVMIASSTVRMIMYINSYDLTFLRILVLWTLGLLAFLFLGVLIYIFRERFPLYRYSIIIVTVLYLVLSFSHPDYIIAKVNVQKQTVDYEYLNTLSADAAPVLIPYIYENKLVKTEKYYLKEIDRDEKSLGIRTFNVARYTASKIKNNYS